MPVRTGFPRTTHRWLQPFYDALDDSLGYVVTSGVSGVANAVWLGRGVSLTMIGNSTGVIGFYGATGIAQVATGGNGILSATYLGASGFVSTGMGNSGLYVHLARFADNGGSGTPYTFSDVVRQLKNMGALPA